MALWTVVLTASRSLFGIYLKKKGCVRSVYILCETISILDPYSSNVLSH